MGSRQLVAEPVRGRGFQMVEDRPLATIRRVQPVPVLTEMQELQVLIDRQDRVNRLQDAIDQRLKEKAALPDPLINGKPCPPRDKFEVRFTVDDLITMCNLDPETAMADITEARKKYAQTQIESGKHGQLVIPFSYGTHVT